MKEYKDIKRAAETAIKYKHAIDDGDDYDTEKI